MNIILYLFIAIAGIVVLLLVTALFSKKSYAIEREITINKPVAEVFDYIRYLRNQDNFNKWVMMDPAMKKEYSGTDGTVGFVYTWDGNKRAGAGEQEIKNINDGKRLDVELRFKRPFTSIASTPFTTEAISTDTTKVKWGINSRMNYPANLFLLFGNMDKMLGNDMETSLATLKDILENKQHNL